MYQLSNAEGSAINSRKTAAIVILVSSSLAWSFFILYAYDFIFKTFTNNGFLVYFGEAIFLGSAAVSAIAGSLIGRKVDRGKFLIAWIILGTLSSIFPVVFPDTIFTLSSVLFGVSLGLGYPCFTAYLADCTKIEERARVSGIVILVTFLLVGFTAAAVSVLEIGLLGFALISVFLRSISYFGLKLDQCRREPGKDRSWRVILTQRNFVLYLFPWLMVCIGSSLTAFVWTGLGSEYESATNIGNVFHYLGAGISGLIAGIAADRFGRKQPIIIGLVTLGVSFAIMGLFTTPFTFAVYLALSGVAWGFLIVLYLTIPGDLSSTGSREKYYALGIVIPLIIFMGLPSLAHLLKISIPANELTNGLSIILFLSVIPVYYAAETLDSAKIRQQRIVRHIKKLEKVVNDAKKHS
jgi:MFS family permease